MSRKVFVFHSRGIGTFILSLIGSSYMGFAQKAPTLREMIDSAILQDDNIANQQLDIELTKIDIQRINEAYLPRLNMNAAGAFLLTSFQVKTPDIEIPQLNIKTLKGENRYTSISNIAMAGIDGTALLYSGGKIPNMRNALSEKAEAQDAILEKRRQAIIYDIVATYDQLALLAQIRLLLNESEKRLAENKKTADKALTYGLSTPYEHQKIEVAQTQLASKIIEYDNQRDVVIQKLFLLTNISKERLLLVTNNNLNVLAVTDQNKSIENRPEIRSLNGIIASSEYRIKAGKTWFMPKIEALGSIGYLGLLNGHFSSSRPVIAGSEKISSKTPNINILPSFRVGVGVRWDFFDGHEGKREVQQAIIEKEKLENQKREVIKQLNLNLTKSQADYAVAASQVAAKATQQQTAWNALTQANKEFKTGLIKSVQLIDAEEDFENASLGLIQAVFNQRRAALSLLQATGNLTVDAVRE